MNQRHIWIAAAVAFVLLASAGVVATIYRDRLNSVAQIRADTRSRALLVAAHAEQGFASAVVALDRAAALLAEAGGRNDALVPQLHLRLDDVVAGNPAVGTLWATDAEGTTWINNNTPTAVSRDIRTRPYFRGALDAGGRLHVGAMEIGTVLQRPRFTLARTYGSEGDPVEGVVVAGINQSYLTDVFARAPAEGRTLLVAYNDRGDVLARTPETADGDGPDPYAALAGLPPGGFGIATLDGWVVAGRRLSSVPLVLAAGTELDGALADWRSRSLQLSLLGLLIGSAFLALTLAGLRSVAREERTRNALLASNEQLEARVAERTRTVELLFRELNHRVKNNLQIIASLLRLQLRKTPDPAVKAILQDSVNRVFAIADVHGEIENAKGGAISLQSYVGKIVGRICDAMQKPGQTIEVDLDVADAELALDRAVLLAIAINEAVTNAFKHAFAQRSGGRLAIRVVVEEGSLVLSVANDGAPADAPAAEEAEPADAVSRSGLGSSIIGMLVQQMSGSVTVDRSRGYEVTLRVPSA